MLSLYTIGSIAKYELRILLRSWFFRIFAILSLFIIGVYSAVCLFENDQFTWAYRSLPSATIYSNFFFLNIFQSIIAVFLATDFLKRDKKLDTSEVLFIRPMSNFEYVTGFWLFYLPPYCCCHQVRFPFAFFR
jgi:ABC-type transport system involved in multi-copper enzyme maturation permease subunit